MFRIQLSLILQQSIYTKYFSERSRHFIHAFYVFMCVGMHLCEHEFIKYSFKIFFRQENYFLVFVLADLVLWVRGVADMFGFVAAAIDNC